MNDLTISAEILERLRAICLFLPEATEKVAWGDPTWRIRNKIFAMQKGNYVGGRPSVWLKGGAGEQDIVVAANPEDYFVPPYVGSKGWIGIWLDRSVDWMLLAELIRNSYRLLAPKRLASMVSIEGSVDPD